MKTFIHTLTITQTQTIINSAQSIVYDNAKKRPFYVTMFGGMETAIRALVKMGLTNEQIINHLQKATGAFTGYSYDTCLIYLCKFKRSIGIARPIRNSNIH